MVAPHSQVQTNRHDLRTRSEIHRARAPLRHTAGKAMGGSSSTALPEGEANPAWRHGSVRVSLSGVSRLVGGQDGWSDEDAHAVYGFIIEWDRSKVHEFSERYSSARKKHDAAAACVLAVSETPFPGKCMLQDMKGDVDSIMERGNDLAQYYTSVCDRAVGDAASQRLLQDVLGLTWPTELLGSGRILDDGRVALVCEGGLTAVAEVRNGSVVELVSAAGEEQGVQNIALTVRAERQMWEQLMRAVLSRAAPGGANTPSTPADIAAEAATAATAVQARAREQKMQDEARRPSLKIPTITLHIHT
jgi:hypothetical protein